ncbi:hypothetical protein FRC20_011417 [Serendipita sp. 405]|nr:hypothetical protein FRC20_011417 [Serendipita sp. 405]
MNSSEVNQNSVESVEEGDDFAEKAMQLLTNAEKKAKKEKLQPPFPMPFTNPAALMYEIEIQRQSANKAENKAALRQTYIGQETHHSTLPLNSLSRISLQEMQVRQRHEGKYLLCRIITPAVRLVSTTFAVEDPNGWAQVISTYNYPGTQYANERELETLLPVHSIIAIREPWAKMALAGDHTHIRIDSPSDVVFLREGDELLTDIRWSSGRRPCTILSRSASEWKSVGDKHFREKEYFPASVAYKRALEKQPSLIAARLNRSLALIKLELYDPALGELRAVLDTTGLPTNDKQKALYRSAQAHYGEGQYDEALKMYRECLILDEALQEALSGIQRCNKRIEEQKNGNFDWTRLCEEILSPDNELDVADFLGPIKIALLANRGGGRGIVATRNIVAGELLLVAKPFAVARQRPDELNMVIAFNFLTKKVDSSRHLEVIHKCVLKLSTGSDDATRDFYDLYAGDDGQHSPVVPSRTKEPRNLFDRDIDANRIETTCSLNWFGIGANPLGLASVRQKDQGMSDLGCALYLLPSYLNHACASNAQRFFFDGIMVIRASRDIASGTEITHSYCSSEDAYQKRKQVLPKWFPECDCSLCTQDRAAGNDRLSKRESLTKRLDSDDLDINELFDIIEQLETSYTTTYGSFRPALSNAHLQVARAFESSYKYAQDNRFLQGAIQHYFIALETREVKIIDHSIDGKKSNKKPLPISKAIVPYNLNTCSFICLAIFRCFSLLNDTLRAERWLRVGLWIESVTSGGGVRMFKLRHATALAQLDEQASSLLAKVEASA